MPVVSSSSACQLRRFLTHRGDHILGVSHLRYALRPSEKRSEQVQEPLFSEDSQSDPDASDN